MNKQKSMLLVQMANRCNRNQIGYVAMLHDEHLSASTEADIMAQLAITMPDEVAAYLQLGIN